MFVFLDMLLGGTALVVKPYHPVWLHRQLCDYEADTWEQLVRMPLDLCNHTALPVPGRRLILELLTEPFDLVLGGCPTGRVNR